MKQSIAGTVAVALVALSASAKSSQLEEYIPRVDAKRVATLISRHLASTEVDAYRPKGFAKDLPEIVCYPEGRPGQFIH